MFIGYLHISLENVYLAPLTIFQLRSFSYRVVRVLYIPDCCCCSVSKSCPTLWNPWTATRLVPLSFTVSQSLLKFMSIESVMLSISSSGAPSPSVLSLSQHQDLFQRVGSLHQVAKVLELQLQHQSFR